MTHRGSLQQLESARPLKNSLRTARHTRHAVCCDGESCLETRSLYLQVVVHQDVADSLVLLPGAVRHLLPEIAKPA